MSEVIPENKRGRGRPTIMDQEAVSRAVLALWDQRGYANVGWQDIADATGVSVRTLTRHFPSKSAIAWVGAVRATEILVRALAGIDDSIEINEAVRIAIVESAELSGYASTNRHAWIKAVAFEPDLVSTAKSAFEPWINTLAEYLHKRLPHLAQFQCQALAQALQAATFAALLSEAVASEHSSATAVVERTLAHMRIIP